MKINMRKWSFLYSLLITCLTIYLGVQNYSLSLKLNHSVDMESLINEDLKDLGEILKKTKLKSSDFEKHGDNVFDFSNNQVTFQLLYITFDSSGRLVEVKSR